MEKTLTPRILVVGSNVELDLPIEYAKDIQSIKEGHYPVIAAPFDDHSLSTLLDKDKTTHWILIGKSPDAKLALQFMNTGQPVYFIENYDSPDFRAAAQKAWEAISSSNLSELKAQKGKKRISTINKQIESLRNTLMNIHISQSSAEMEKLVFDSLKNQFDLAWARLFFQSPEQISTHLSRLPDIKVFQHQLRLGSAHLGTIVFARKSNKSFSKTEEESLVQVAESVALNLDRLAKLDQAAILQQQWDATFNAISEPLCLTDEKFNVLRTNNAFSQVTRLKPQKLKGMNCFMAFCGSATPTALKSHTDSFIIEQGKTKSAEPRYYVVVSQRIQLHIDEPSILLIMFRDITEQMKIEKQMFESAKMVELGTIGSSIAHDINNPLGGMISFLQLIKMDLKNDDPVFEDILEMEKAGKKCKEIVENLLRFSRPQDDGEKERVDLDSAIQAALKVIELQTQSSGIQVSYIGPTGRSYVLGYSNPLSQALSHIFQNAADAVSEMIKSSPRKKGQINIRLMNDDKEISIAIEDNGIGISPELQSKILNPLFSTKTRSENQGLGLTLAYKIIYDHGGRLDISSQPNIGTAVKISFPNV